MPIGLVHATLPLRTLSNWRYINGRIHSFVHSFTKPRFSGRRSLHYRPTCQIIDFLLLGLPSVYNSLTVCNMMPQKFNDIVLIVHWK